MGLLKEEASQESDSAIYQVHTFYHPALSLQAQSSYLKHPSVQTYILKAWMMSDALIFSVHLRQYQHSYGFVMCSSEQFEHLHLHEKMLILNKFL